MCTAFDYWTLSTNGPELVLVYTIAVAVVVARLLAALGCGPSGRWVRGGALTLFAAAGIWMTAAYLMAPAQPPLPAVVPASSLSPWARTPPIEDYVLDI
jgi:hypothetical protein